MIWEIPLTALIIAFAYLFNTWLKVGKQVSDERMNEMSESVDQVMKAHLDIYAILGTLSSADTLLKTDLADYKKRVDVLTLKAGFKL